MMNIGEMNIGIDIDPRKFNSGVKKIKNTIGDLNKEFIQLADTSLDIGQSLAKNVVLPLSLLGGVSTKIAGDFETMKVSLEGFAGSKKAAVELFETMKEFSATTPFQLDDIASAGKIMLGMTYPIETLLDDMRMLGDVAAGANAPLADIAKIFGKIKTKGKASMEEINQLVERQIPIIDELTKRYANSTEFFAAMRQGKVSFNQVNDAIINMTSSGGIFFNQTIKQSKTLNGKLSTLYDNIKNTAAALGDELLPMAKAALDYGIQFLTLIQSIPKSVIYTIAVFSTLVTVGAAFTAGLLITVGMLGFMFGETYKTYKVMKAMIPLAWTGNKAIMIKNQLVKTSAAQITHILKTTQTLYIAEMKHNAMLKGKLLLQKRFIAGQITEVKLKTLNSKLESVLNKKYKVNGALHDKYRLNYQELNKLNFEAVTGAASLNKLKSVSIGILNKIKTVMISISSLSVAQVANFKAMTWSLSGIRTLLITIGVTLKGIATLALKIAWPAVLIYTLVSAVNGAWLSMNDILWLILVPLGSFIALIEVIGAGVLMVLSVVGSGLVWAVYGILQAVDGIMIVLFNVFNYLKGVGVAVVGTMTDAFTNWYENVKIIGSNISELFTNIPEILSHSFKTAFNEVVTGLAFMFGKVLYYAKRSEAALKGNFSGEGIKDYSGLTKKLGVKFETEAPKLNLQSLKSLPKPKQYKMHEWDSTSPLKGALDATAGAAKSTYNFGLDTFESAISGEGIGGGILDFANKLFDTPAIKGIKTNKTGDVGELDAVGGSGEKGFGEMMFKGSLSSYQNELKLQGGGKSKVDTATINTEKNTRNMNKNIEIIAKNKQQELDK